MSYKVTFTLSQSLPLYTCLTRFMGPNLSTWVFPLLSLTISSLNDRDSLPIPYWGYELEFGEDRSAVLKMKIWIYWSYSNSWIYFYLVLNKIWKIYRSEQSFAGLEAGGPVLIVRTGSVLPAMFPVLSRNTLKTFKLPRNWNALFNSQW